MRTPIVAANWKMNNTTEEGELLIESIKPLVVKAKCEVVICPPSTALYILHQEIKGTNIKIGAQNVHYAESGAFTGEISVQMLQDLGVEYVIVGHSERRQYFAETDETVNKRAKAALEGGMKVIVCIGETLEQRNSKQTEEVVKKQMQLSLCGISDFNNTIIAYEPVWAIGTGVAATIEQVSEVITFIRRTVGEMFGAKSAEKVRILYGGSVCPKNAKEIFALDDVDGGLVGGASLNAESFGEIVNSI